VVTEVEPLVAKIESEKREQRKALLVVDMLNDFVLPDGALSVGEVGPLIVPALAEHIREARAEGTPVIYLCDRHRPDDAEFADFPPHCIQGTSGADIVKELVPQPGDIVVPKRRYSGFFGTDLHMTLRELGITDVILTGVCTNICVLYTAADARMLGFNVEVFTDSVASFDNEAHKWALKELQNTLGAWLT